MSRYDRHMRNDAIKWFIAFFLIIVLLVGGVFGGLELWGKGNAKPSNWGKKDEELEEPAPKDISVQFQAENGKIEGAVKEIEETVSYVKDFTAGTKVSFTVEAGAAVQKAKMSIRFTTPKEDSVVTDVITMTINGKVLKSPIKIAGAKDGAESWAYVIIGEIELVKGTNTFVFGGTEANVKFDYFMLTVPENVTLVQKAEA